MIYEIKKINVSAYTSDGQPVYDQSETFSNVASMFRRLREMSQRENCWFVGKGSHIIKNGEVIAHTSNYDDITISVDQWTGRETKVRPSLKSLLLSAEEYPYAIG